MGNNEIILSQGFPGCKAELPEMRKEKTGNRGFCFAFWGMPWYNIKNIPNGKVVCAVKDHGKSTYRKLMLAGFGAISLSVAFFFLLYRMQSLWQGLDKIIGILMPFIYGSVIAYLLRPICNCYAAGLRKWLPGKLKTMTKLTEGLAIAGSLITGILIVYMMIIMIGPQLVESVITLWNSIPGMVDQLVAWVSSEFGENEVLLNYLDASYETIYKTLDDWVRNTLVPNISNILGGVGMSVWKVLLFFKNLLLGLIVAVYILGSRKLFARQSVMVIQSALKPRWAELVLSEIKFIDELFTGFVDGKLVDSAIIGVLCYFGCLLLRLPNALAVAAIVGITNIIPFFGPFLGAIPATLLILIESPIKALWFILFVLVLQQVDGNIIGPKILGQHTGVSSFWVMFAIILFGGLWGIVGMVIGVPLFAVLYDIARRLVHRGLEKNHCDDLSAPEKTKP